MATATSSPVLSNNGSETSANTAVSTPPPPPSATPSAAGKSPGLPTITLQRPEPPKNLRGLNKPKCIKCGNVARSRCPYQSCKSCCSKAQNPCHIHVLKPNSTLADRGASSTSTLPEQQPNEAAAPGPQSKANSLRQLSSTFSQFNNVHVSLKSRKPLTRKEALTINEWRFAKLKECQEGNIEAENEAFDRYIQNTNLLEEVFHVNSESSDKNESMVSTPPTASDERTEMISETKVLLRSHPVRIDTFRKRIWQTIDHGLKKLQTDNSNDGPSNLDHEDEPAPKAAKNWWSVKTSALDELNLKLNKAQNEEDLKLCFQMKSNIIDQQLNLGKKTENSEISEEQISQNTMPSAQESDNSLHWVRSVEIDQQTLNCVNARFSSIEEIEDL